MDQKRHYQLLATLHIIAGILGLIFLAFMRLFFSFLFPFVTEAVQNVEPIASFFVEFGFDILQFLGYFVLFGTVIPSIVGAIGLVQNKSWGIYLLIISGCIRLIDFPLGTSLGIYTLWVHFKFQNQSINDQNQ
jgi:magnesium-transporting ATPase (P-type)